MISVCRPGGISGSASIRVYALAAGGELEREQTRIHSRIPRRMNTDRPVLTCPINACRRSSS